MKPDNFENWNLEKQQIEKIKNLRTFREWEIWYISMWKNIWYEQNWKGSDFLRPILIIKKFNKNIFYWIPLTSKIKNNKFYFQFESNKWKINYAILSQMRLFDSKRLISNIWTIKYKDIKELKKKLIKLIF